MRFTVAADDLTDDQWHKAQELLQPSYDIPDGATRVCLTLTHGDEVRHVETPAGVLFSLVGTLILAPVLKQAKMMMALLTPDDESLPK